MKTVSTVGFIGVGRLGYPMAVSLLEAGYPVVCTARGRSAELISKGATIPGDGTPRAVAEAADVVLTCLASVASLEQVVQGENGLLAADRAPVVFEMSTLPLEAKRAACERLAARGGGLLDAPISGTPPMAAAKIAVIYSSGDRGAHDKYEAVLKAMAPASVYVGEFGAGTKMKYVAQFLATIHATATCEAMAYAELAGMDLAEVAKVISASPGATSGQFQIRAPMIVGGRFEGQLVTVDTMLKDVDQVLEYGTEIGAPTDMLSIVHQRFHELAERGDGQAEPAKLYPALLEEARAGESAS